MKLLRLKFPYMKTGFFFLVMDTVIVTASAGLLEMHPDDIRIPDSFSLAEKCGLAYRFTTKNLRDAHPNTAVLSLTGKNGRTLEIQAACRAGWIPPRRHTF